MFAYNAFTQIHSHNSRSKCLIGTPASRRPRQSHLRIKSIRTTTQGHSLSVIGAHIQIQQRITIQTTGGVIKSPMKRSAEMTDSWNAGYDHRSPTHRLQPISQCTSFHFPYVSITPTTTTATEGMHHATATRPDHADMPSTQRPITALSALRDRYCNLDPE